MTPRQSVQRFINQYITDFNQWLYRLGVLEFILATSTDPDEILHSVAFHHGLH